MGQIAHLLHLSKPYHRLIARLVRKSGLFDEEHYRRQNPDVAECGMDPLWHYVAHGDREGRRPTPLFDPCHYRATAGRPHCRSLNALVHYCLLGRYKGCTTSLWFDAGYYLANNPDVKLGGMDPLLHFLRHGGKEGRCPSPSYDMARFSRGSPCPRETDVNPLLHYIEKDHLENWPFLQMPPGSQVSGCMLEATAPKEEEWANVPLPLREKPAVVDVIIPIYSGAAETLRCLYHVLRYPQATPFELVVVNDASPDAELVSAVRRLADQGYITYLENAVNQGFVRSVNRGMRFHADRDAILLNSDAEPYNDWLDRLRAAAYREERSATVTPLSNNATICSYPVFNRDNPYPLELTGEELDLLARQVNQGLTVPAPTAVGFCVYIRRAALDALGLFDEKPFGLGYGEENDFSQRAIRHGWNNVVATDVYVRHWGSTSFKDRQGKHMLKALRVLDRRYPNYRNDVAAYIAADPLKPSRRRMDEARLVRCASSRNVLVVTHQRGGGNRAFCHPRSETSAAGWGKRILSPSGRRQSACPFKLCGNRLPPQPGTDRAAFA